MWLVIRAVLNVECVYCGLWLCDGGVLAGEEGRHGVWGCGYVSDVQGLNAKFLLLLLWF